MFYQRLDSSDDDDDDDDNEDDEISIITYLKNILKSWIRNQLQVISHTFP